jgi:antitoxin StbD
MMVPTIAVLTWPDPLMAQRVLTETAVRSSEHNKNPMATVAAFYCVPAKAYEELMDLLEDLELGRLADARLADGEEPLRVSLDAR